MTKFGTEKKKKIGIEKKKKTEKQNIVWKTFVLKLTEEFHFSVKVLFYADSLFSMLVLFNVNFPSLFWRGKGCV